MSDVPLDELAARCGGDAEAVRQLALRHGGALGSDWAGRPVVTAETARRVVEAHDAEAAKAAAQPVNDALRDAARGKRSGRIELRGKSAQDLAEHIRERVEPKPMEEP